MAVNTRNVFLGALIALVMLASALLTIAPKASAEITDKSDCPNGKVCLWSGPTFGGQQSFWNAWETGYHGLENIDPQSVYNRTSNRVAVFFIGPFKVELGVYPGETFQFGSPYTGGFDIR
jgi:hypothetical protein